MNAYDFINSIPCPVVFIASIGTPMGTDTAIFSGCDPEFGFDLSDAEGEVRDGWWHWDGEGDFTDLRNNTITLIQVRNHKEIFEAQEADYNNGY